MRNIQISGLYVYPIKSCGGISLQKSILDGKGLKYDRRWMLVDEGGAYITQRKFPQLALVKTVIDGNDLIIFADGRTGLHVGTEETTGEMVTVKVWNDVCESNVVSSAANEWFFEFLDKKVRLVYMPENVIRSVDPNYSVGPFSTAFTDGFPILLISEASLDDLNSRLENPVPMDRFRPNIVVSGTVPFEEDGWRSIKTGDVQMHVVKPCARCVITTTDQQTAQRSKEPLTTLAKFRTQNKKIMFGQNVIHQNTGTLNVGDTINVNE
jgi:MOSC domain-containing protein